MALTEGDTTDAGDCRTVSRPRWLGLLSVCLIAGSALAGIALWARLPAEMAIHFDAGQSGQPRRKAAGGLLGTAVGVVGIAITLLAGGADTGGQ